MKKEESILKEKEEARRSFLSQWRHCSGLVWVREKVLVQGLMGRWKFLKKGEDEREKQPFCLEKLE